MKITICIKKYNVFSIAKSALKPCMSLFELINYVTDVAEQ